MLKIENLKKSLGGKTVLDGVNLHIKEGERVVVIGRSGGGKSVLLRNIIGLLRPDEGSVRFRDVNLAVLAEEELNPYRRRIGMLFQGGALFDSLSVEDNLAFPLREKNKMSEVEIRKRVAESLELVDLPGQEQTMPVDLSGGMKKRVALARAIISKPELMLYDEPTTGLDPIVADSINHLILRLAKKFNMASIVVTHDMVSASFIANKISYLYEGKIYFEGTPEEVKNCSDPTVRKFVRGISEPHDVMF